MKTKYLALLVAAMGSGLSFGASIDGLDAAYSKNLTAYNGTTGDVLNVSSPTTLGVNANGSWTMAFTISDLGVTPGSNVGLLFTYNTGSYKNLEGLGFQLTESGTLTLCAGGFAYNGNPSASSSWKTQTFSDYSTSTPLTLFYTFNRGNVSISAMLGDDTSTLTTLSSLSSGAAFSGQNMTQINFSAKDASGNTWTAPNGITGEYTLNNFDLYTEVLTEEQMTAYALSSVPEPGCGLPGPAGSGHPSDAPPQGLTFSLPRPFLLRSGMDVFFTLFQISFSFFLDALMKVRLPLPLLAALAAAFPAATAAPAGTELGNVMFVGDSITHGVNSASYRWALHKIFTDNGISYRAEGVKTGNDSGGVTAGTSYGGQIFNNEHSSQANARAWEISGRSNGSRFDGSNINNWLGLSGTKANGSAYSGQTFTGDNTPDTFFMMIGTNDLLSDGNNATLANRLDSVSQNLLNDMDTIVEAMFQANEHANVIILTIPCWTRHSNGNSDATHQAVADYNDRLKTWGNGRQNVTVIDVNAGIIDVTSSTPFYGVSSMFNNPGSDGLHPNAQGDLLMAGNIARAMGYAGRTAGQERKAAGGLAINFHQGGQSPAWSSNSQLENKGFSLANVTVDENGISLGQSGESSISYSWAEGTDLQNGFTFDCNLVLGNGAADGWDTASDFSISLGNSSFYGTLNINEAYIKWGDAILYSLDMSANAENLRMAYIRGNELEGLKGGYYVWLGDMLIGEALSVTSGSGCNGLTIQYNGSGTAVLHDLALDGTGSYAPATSGTLNAEKSFISSGSFTQSGTPEGNIEWKTEGFTKTADNLAGSGTFNARAQADSSAGGTGNSVNVSITSGNATHIYANSGNYTGDVWLTISKEGQASAWYGAHGASGTLNGNVFLRFTDAATGGSTVFGAVNAAGVTGNVYLEFSAENASFGTFTSSNSSSVVGSYATDIQGNVDIVVNSGTFNHQIMGGIFANARIGTTTIGGNTHVYINGGSVTGNVMGGGLTGSISGGANVTVTGGVISGSVYGAGQGGSILAGSSVCLTGGLVKGDVYAGGKAGSIQGDTSVTITGNTATLYNGSSWGSISGGGSGGTVDGNSTVRIQNLSSGTTAYGFDKYAGNISGGTNVSGDRSLVLDYVTVDSLQASLSNFTHVSAVNQTRTSLDSLGGALTVTIEAGSSLILNGTSNLTTLILGEHASLTLQGLTADAVVVDITGTSNYTLSLTEIPASLDNIKFLNDGVLYDAAMSMDLQANSAMLFAQVPEPGSAALALAGLAPLLWRRRRKMSH